MHFVSRAVSRCIFCLLFVPNTAAAITSEEAFLVGQVSKIWSFCPNRLTGAADELVEMLSDASRAHPDEYQRGFYSIHELPGYQETEEQGLGTLQRNGIRRAFCDYVVGPRFPQWVIVE